MSHIWVFEWHAWFRVDWTSIQDDQHTSVSFSSTTPYTAAKLQQLVCDCRYKTIQDLADETGIGYGTCQWIMTAELHIQHIVILS
jgi:hypothetical protein